MWRLGQTARGGEAMNAIPVHGPGRGCSEQQKGSSAWGLHSIKRGDLTRCGTDGRHGDPPWSIE